MHRIVKTTFQQSARRSFNASRHHVKRLSTVADADEQNLKPLAYWLLGVGGLVAGMVTVGGITRLTKSGLSMTDWRLQGTLPPLSHEQWEAEFERYKTFPEWQQRKSMTLSEFKFIYFWEYGHRMMGRFIGLAYVGPLVYFSYRRMIPRSLYPRLGVLFSLGASQGLIGWWMVKSGLELKVDSNYTKEIRVSPYRLATHLTMAFTTYATLLWTGLDLLNTTNIAKATTASFPQNIMDTARKMRRLSFHNGALVALTAISGAYVAGNDAGRAYNSFPKMGDDWIPPEIIDKTLNPIWRNFFENTATVQFDHRILAMSTITAIWYQYCRARLAENGLFWKSLPSFSRLAFNAAASMSVVQVGLGISTLLLYVPIPLAATHQAGSLVLLTCVTALAHSLKFSRFASVLSTQAVVRSVASAIPK